MSALEKQLNRIAASADSRLTQSLAQATPSYLFSSRVASQQLLDDVQAQAHNSFLTLVSSEPELSKYERYFFGPDVKRFDRGLATPDQVKEIKTNVNALLALLAPMVLTESAAWVIEWLIRKFRIHEFNVEATLALFLPYHETPQFLHLAQLLHLQGLRKFQFLAKTKGLSQPIPKEVIVDQLSCSNDFLSFCSSILLTPLPFEKLPHGHVSFWTCAMLGFLTSKRNIDESQVNLLVRSCTNILKKFSDPEAQSAVYLVVSKLASTTAQIHLYIQPLILALLISAQSRKLQGSNKSQSRVSLCAPIALLFNSSESDILPQNCLNALFNMPQLSSFLIDMLSLRPISDKFVTAVIKIFASHASNQKQFLAFSELLSNESFLKQFGQFAIKEILSSNSDKTFDLLKVVYTHDPSLFSDIRPDNSHSEEIKQKQEELITTVQQSEKPDLNKHLPLSRETFDRVLVHTRKILRQDPDMPVSTFKSLLQFIENAATINHDSDSDRIFFDIYLDWILPVQSKLKRNKAAWKSIQNSKLNSFGICKDLASCWQNDDSSTSDYTQKIVNHLTQNIIDSKNHQQQQKYVSILVSKFAHASTNSTRISSALILAQILAQQPRIIDTKSSCIVINAYDRLPSSSHANNASARSAIIQDLYNKDFTEKLLRKAYDLLLHSFCMSLSLPDFDTQRPLIFDSWPDQQSKVLFTAIYNQMHVLPNQESVIQKLYTWVGGHQNCVRILSALAANVNSTTAQISTAYIALRELTAVVSSDPKSSVPDFPIIPVALIALYRGTYNERQAALSLIQLISDRFGQNLVTMSSLPKKASSESPSRPKSSNMQNYLSKILSSKDELLRDGSIISSPDFGDTSSKRSVSGTIANYVLLWPSVQPRLDLLKIVLPRVDQNAFNILLQNIKSTINSNKSDIGKLDSSSASNYCNTIFELFNRFPRSLEVAEIQDALESLFNATKMTGSNYEAPIRQAALNVIKLKFFNFVQDDIKFEIVFCLLQLLNETNDLDSHYEYVECLHSLELPVSTAISVMDNLRQNLGSKASSPSKQEQQHIGQPLTRDQAVQLVAFFLEHGRFNQAINDKTFVKTIFDTLVGLVAARPAIGLKGDGAISQTLNILRKIASKVVKNNDPTNKADGFASIVNISPLLDLPRVSENPQIRDDSLELVGSFARLAQEQVLQNVLPIFTFMGSSSLTRDDASSARLVKNTIKSVISILVNSGEVSSDFLRILLDTFSHVPHHRRTWVHTCLVSTLGPVQFLGKITSLIILGEASQPVTDRQSTSFALALDLFERFDAEAQVHAGIAITERINDMLRHRDESLPPPVLSLAAFLERALGSRKLSIRVKSQERVKKAAIHNLVKTLVINAINIDISLQDSALDSQVSTCLATMTEQIARVMSADIFNETISELLKLDNSVQMLSHCLRLYQVGLSRKQAGIDPTGLAIIQRIVKMSSEMDQVQKEQSLDTLSMIVRDGSDNERAAIIAPYPGLLSWFIDTTESSIFLSGLQVISSLATKLKNYFLPLGDSTLNSLVKLAADNKEKFEITLPTFTVIETIFRSAPILLDMHLKDALNVYLECMSQSLPETSAISSTSDDEESVASSSGSSLEDDEDEDDYADEEDLAESDDKESLISIMEQVAQISCSSMVTALCGLDNFNPSKALYTIDLLQRTIGFATSQTISSMKQTILGMFFKLYQITETKDNLNELLVNTAFKLTEKDFKPMFTRLCDWVVEDGIDISGERFVALVNALHQLITRFQTIIIPYVDYVIGIMNETNFIDIVSKAPGETWDALSNMFIEAFEYESDDFWKNKHFSTIFTAFDQLITRVQEVDEERIANTQAVFECFGQNCKDSTLISKTYRNMNSLSKLDTEDKTSNKTTTMVLGLSALRGLWESYSSGNNSTATKAIRPLVSETKSILLELVELGDDSTQTKLARLFLNEL